MKFTVHGAYENPQKARSYARFSSKLDYATLEEAQEVAKIWETERDYPYIWVEEGE